MVSAELKNRIATLIAMTNLLERVDVRPALVGAEQYRSLVRLVCSLLEQELPDDVLRTVLRASPVVASLYENLHYGRSGLSQSPLDQAVSSELDMRRVLERMRTPV